MNPMELALIAAFRAGQSASDTTQDLATAVGQLVEQTIETNRLLATQNTAWARLFDLYRTGRPPQTAEPDTDASPKKPCGCHEVTS